MSEHVVLVAFTVEANTMEAAQYRLMDKLVDVTRNDSAVEEWWVAEDERYDRSDNEAAVFVPEGLTTREARMILEWAVANKEDVLRAYADTQGDDRG